ncbi:hypothetical protein ACFWY9_05650 [Amycolatopsis sp. NPDC059027]|uniref:hypothetical protein n=1 Tax=Amycolatopsis sp. NPDC059027 TaxID=3346709 RepID=UPI00366B2FDC
MSVLDPLQFGEQLVELAIGDDGGVQHVIPELVAANLFGERGMPLTDLGRHLRDVLGGVEGGLVGDLVLGKLGAHG